MFERLQKPFLTVETGEAYQPIRLTYTLHQKDNLIQALNGLKCCEKNPSGTAWNWYWKDECDAIHFESLESFKKNSAHPVRLGTFSLRNDKLYLNLASFKRACLAVPFFHKNVNPHFASVNKADFLNKVFGLDERLPHGFTELFKEEELEKIVMQRIHEFAIVQERVEYAATADEAFSILNTYTSAEAQKRLPYAERYVFNYQLDDADIDVLFLSFYIFLRSRELVAIRRWFGESAVTLQDIVDDTVDQIFGGMDIDIIE